MKKLTIQEQQEAITQGIKEALLTALGIDPRNRLDTNQFRHDVLSAISYGVQKALLEMEIERSVIENRVKAPERPGTPRSGSEDSVG